VDDEESRYKKVTLRKGIPTSDDSELEDFNNKI
jgi:hypothetical protein